MTEDLQEDQERTRRHAPSHTLAEAIGYLAAIDRSLGQGPYGRDSMADALGHKPGTGPFSRKAGTLSHYGLTERTGTSLKLSKLGSSILRPTSDGEKRKAIANAARQPLLYQELITRFGGNALPSLLPNILIRDFGVHRNSSDEVARIFRETMTFAGLLRHDILHQEPVEVVNDPFSALGFPNLPLKDGKTAEGEKTVSKFQVGDHIQWAPNGVLQFSEPRKVTKVHEADGFLLVEGSNTGIPINEATLADKGTAGLVPNATELPFEGTQGRSSLSKRDVFTLSEGQVIVQWPSEISAEDLQDIEDWLPILLRKIRRSVPLN